jgi:hypothetical protein
MGAVEDARKLVQDLLAPELKALAVGVEALEAEVKLRFNSAEEEATLRHVRSGPCLCFNITTGKKL